MMKQMGKRLLAMLLTVAILLPLFPARALAADGDEPADTGAQSGGFADVPEGEWFYDAVDYVFSHDIFKGISDTEFDPQGTMTRAMMVTVLGRIAQIDPDDYTGPSQFTDVAQGSWYTPYVNWAAETSITLGVGEGRFDPETPITRAQMAVFLWRFYRYLDAPLPDQVTDSLPEDYDVIPGYAQQAAADLWRSGVFKGYGDNRFAPGRNLTRAEAAQLCQRVDTYLVDSGIKEYPEDEEPAPSPDPGWNPGTSDPGDSERDVIYKPEATDQQTTATQVDAPTNFSITVVSSDSGLTAEKVKEMITATDLSDQGEDGNALADCIEVKDNGNNTYTITGVHTAYDKYGEDGKPEQVNTFAPGHSYKIVLDDDRLTFQGQAASVREYDFTVARQEEMNVQLQEGLTYIPAGAISNITSDGQQVQSLEVSPFNVTEDGIEQGADMGKTGTFNYSGVALSVGDTLAVYEGDAKPEANDNSSESISYVTITKVTGNTYTYRAAEVDEVMFMPDMFPLPATYLNGDTGTIKVPASAFVFSEDKYTEMGLDGETTVDKGDFIAFYEGYLDLTATTSESSDETVYAEITSVKQDGDNYTIEYRVDSLENLMASTNTYVEDNAKIELSEAEIAGLEKSIELEAQASGFAQQAAEEIARLALQTDDMARLQNELGLTEVNGVPVVAAAANNAILPRAASGGGSGNQVSLSIDVANIKADITTDLEHFSDVDGGLRVALTIPFTVSFEQNNSSALELKFTPTFIQELYIGISASVDTIWDNFIYIIWWIDDFRVNANVDLYTYTDIRIDVEVTTDDGQTDVEDVIDFVDQLKQLLEGGGGDEEDAETLAERYKAMLENDSDWVELFRQQIFNFKRNLAMVIQFKVDISIVLSANVNVYIGLDFSHEMARRYVFTISVFEGEGTCDTISLVPEHYTLDVYVMGKLGLRLGLQVTIGVALISDSVLGASLTTEVGPYLDLYGFFHYHLEHEENKELISQAAGAMYVEVGIYLDLSANVTAIGGLVSWNPTIFTRQFPLWSAGNRYPIIEVETQVYAPIEFEFGNPGCLPNTRPTLVSMDLKTGKETKRQYDWDEFEITTTNDAVWYDPQYHVLWAQTPYLELDMVEEGQVVIAWKGDNGCLAFNTQPIQYTIDFRWTRERPDGYQIFLITGTDPVWIEYDGGFNDIVNYDEPDLYGGTMPEGFDPDSLSRPGYQFIGWEDAKGIPVETLPANMPAPDDGGPSTYYYAQWEALPVGYTIEYYYEVLGVTKETDTSGYVQQSGKWYELKKTDTVTTNSTIVTGQQINATLCNPTQALSDPNATLAAQWPVIASHNAVDNVLEVYYDRGTYQATFECEDLGIYIYQYYKVGETIEEPTIDPPAGYTFTGWNVSGTMPAENVTYEAENGYEANRDTPYTVEHYVQGTDGAYVLQETEYLAGTTDTTATVELNEYTNCGTGTYSPTTIKGDGSTVVKVRYARTDLRTATFYDGSRVVSRVYFSDQDSWNSIIAAPPVLTGADGETAQWRYEVDGQIRYGLPETVPQTDMSFYADWQVGEQANYTVEYYVQGVDGSYPDSATETVEGKIGTVGENAAYDPLYPEDPGFSIDNNLTIPVQVSSDGNTVLKVYYQRNTYDLTYNLNGGSGFAEGITPATDGTYTVKVLYGATVTLLGSDAVTGPERKVLAGWSTSQDDALLTKYTMPAEDTTLYAQWTDGYVITVTHHKEKADYEAGATGADKYDTEQQIITVPNTEASYTPALKTYDHFKPAEGEVAEAVTFVSGQTEYSVDYYYNRETYTLTVNYTESIYDADTGTVSTPVPKEPTFNVRYDQTLTTVFNGAKADGDPTDGLDSLNYGYLLSGFKDEKDNSYTTMPAQDLAVTAQWVGDTFSFYYNYDGRMDLVNALKTLLGDDKVSINERTDVSVELTYGKETVLPDTIPGLLSIGDCQPNEDLSTELYGQPQLQLPSWAEGGNGQSADSPYMIYTWGTFSSIWSEATSGVTYFQLGADLDCEWLFGAQKATFPTKQDSDGSGGLVTLIDYSKAIHLDGGGHTISNLQIERTTASEDGDVNFNAAGLFGLLTDGSTVKNLTLKKVTVSSDTHYDYVSDMGVLAGTAVGEVTIDNVKVENCSINATEAIDGSFGGLVGSVIAADIDGGMATNPTELTITGCTVEALTITGGTESHCGAFVGSVETGATVTGSGNTDTGTLPDIGYSAASDGSAAIPMPTDPDTDTGGTDTGTDPGTGSDGTGTDTGGTDAPTQLFLQDRALPTVRAAVPTGKRSAKCRMAR